MANNITLITSPDFFENSNKSIMVINIDPKESEEVNVYFEKFEQDFDVNLYVYTGEPYVPWLLHSLERSDFVYVNVDNLMGVTEPLIGYIISKSNVYYKTINVNTKEVFGYINRKSVGNITEFLRKAFEERTNAIM
jgi:hypothetical protein